MATQVLHRWHSSATLRIFGSWAGTLLVVLVGIWVIALHQIDEREERFRWRAIDALSDEATQVAGEISETVRGADNLLLLLKEEIERGQDISHYEVYTKSVLGGKAARIFVVDAAGKPVAVALPGGGGRLPAQLYLQGLASEPGLHMRIDHGLASTAQGNVRLIAFSRRIDRSDRKFGGAVVIEMAASDLASVDGQVSLRHATQVLLRTPDGVDLHVSGQRPGSLGLRPADYLHTESLSIF